MGRITATRLAFRKIMTDCILVMTNLPDTATALKMAQQIIESGTAACVNQLSPCTSVYRWNMKIETVSEVPLLIKTSSAAYAQLESLIRACHPYELPEIIAVPITSGLPAYLNWVSQETRLSCKAFAGPAPLPPTASPQRESDVISLRESYVLPCKE